jgi:hypothetical protein
LTEIAYADLDRLMTSLAGRSRGAGDRLSARFYESLPRLESNPFACGLDFENPASPEELRYLLFKVKKKGRKYRALFIVHGDVVKALTIRAPGERPVTPEDIET